MKKRVSIFLAALLFLAIAAPQVSALEIRVSQTGVMYFYQDGVLGETDGVESDDDRIEEEEPTEAVEVESDEQVEVKNEDGSIRLQVTQKNREMEREVKKQQLEQLKETKTKRLKMQVPAGMDKKQVNRQIQDEKELLEQKLKTLTDLPEASREAKKKELEQKWEERKKQLEELKETRSERLNEFLELKSELTEDGQQKLELKSRNVRAELKGADFSFDPETNQVTLTTPSGNVHLLKHLPDQAVEKFRERAGVVDIEDPEEVEVETNEEGEVVYTANTEVEKKLLGIFKRKVKTQLILNDDTGEVTQETMAGGSLLDQILNVWSF